jgi:tetratricopeptide (TPR) repeat protein
MRARRLGIALALAALVVACFAPVLDNGFIDLYDDGKYVTQNPNVQHGLDAASLRWALTTTTASNWHPLTWVSHILDVSASGLRPAGHHLTSVLLHALTTALLFLALTRLTGDVGRSTAAAALFGVHPLRLESVAWVAERKDVLSGLLFVIVLLLYARYVEEPRPRRMAAVAGALALGLMAKPMLVTTPFVLLLLDVWPLGRKGWRNLVLEKAPLFVLSLASCAATVWAQSAHAVRSLEEFPLGVRIENAIVAYAAYLAKTVWPAKLAVLYPHPGANIETWKVLVSIVVLGAITVATLALRRDEAVAPRRLALVRRHARAGDRTRAGRAGGDGGSVHLSPLDRTRDHAVLVGAGHASDRDRRRRRRLGARRGDPLPGGVLEGFGHPLHPRDRGHPRQRHRALEPRLRALPEGRPPGRDPARPGGDPDPPRFQPPRYNLGIALADAGRIDDAVESFRRAIELDPGDSDVYNNLGTTYYRTRRLDEAIAAFREAVSRAPKHANARYNLGTALAAKGQYSEAAIVLRDAARLDPGNASVHANLAGVLVATGDREGAWREVDAMRALGREPPASLLEKLGPR